MIFSPCVVLVYSHATVPIMLPAERPSFNLPMKNLTFPVSQTQVYQLSLERLTSHCQLIQVHAEISAQLA